MAVITPPFIFNVHLPLAWEGGQGAGGAEASWEEEMKKTKSRNHTGKNPLCTQELDSPPHTLSSIYHDGTQGEVSVWVNPQVLQEGKRKNTDSEYSGWLAWKVGTLNEWLTLWSRRWQRWRLCHHFVHCGESIRRSVKTTPITTQRNLQIKSIHHHNVPGLFEVLWPLLSGVKRSSASAAPDAVSAPAEAAAAPLDIGVIGVSELPAKRKKTPLINQNITKKSSAEKKKRKLTYCEDLVQIGFAQILYWLLQFSHGWTNRSHQRLLTHCWPFCCIWLTQLLHEVEILENRGHSVKHWPRKRKIKSQCANLSSITFKKQIWSCMSASWLSSALLPRSRATSCSSFWTCTSTWLPTEASWVLRSSLTWVPVMLTVLTSSVNKSVLSCCSAWTKAWESRDMRGYQRKFTRAYWDSYFYYIQKDMT